MLNAQIALSLRRATGLALAPAIVDRAIRQRMKQCAITMPDAYAARFHQDDGELSALTELVVVPETWMFRDPEAFRAAVQFAQQRLADGRGPVSFLSLPCATGEEPYSLAMALLDAGVPSTGFTIDAIDISHHALEHARRGIYGRNAFRSRELDFRERHFVRTEQGYELNPHIRALVNFSQGNLLAIDSTPAARYDVIFCRNLLIYFDQPTQAAAIRTLSALLHDDGMLFAGYAEAGAFHPRQFRPIPHPMAFCLRKAPHAEERRQADTAPKAGSAAGSMTALRPLVRKPSTAPAKRSTSPARPSAARVAPDPAALLEKACRLADEGDMETAGKLLSDYLQHVPDSAQAWLLQALICERKGDLGTAESHLRRAVYLDPQHYDALCHLALLAEQQGKAAAAAAARERAARVFRRRSAGRTGKE